MLQVTFVGTGPYYRLPEVMAGPGVRITVVGGHRHPLRSSRFVDRFVGLDDGVDLAAALLARPDVVAALDGWVVVGDDTLLRRLAVSELPERDKLRVLPVRERPGLPLPGSKVGLDALCRLAGVAVPATCVAACPADVPGAVATVRAVAGAGTPILVKADEGWGGDQVRGWDLLGTAEAIPDSWFPVVVQQAVAGPEVSVDALFRDGCLVGWTYSRVAATGSRYGASSTRVYLRPPADDFAADLASVGRVGGLHGFYNCSFIWSPEQRRHLLFELDGRPTAWAQFGPSLGVDWVRQMSQPCPGVAQPALGPDEFRVIRLYPRSIVAGFDRRDLARLRPWLLGLPGTWDTRNARDRAVNAVDRSDALAAAGHWARLEAAIALDRAWRRLPGRVHAVADRPSGGSPVGSRG